ncbi:hypothetical protein SteCoe_5639 [Stentor coeruleus]|uniref:Uncharacterized protein n=1 Tax=Stentor coeruleus TaxID=5963 RepID=A0A1R2CRY4_9CILI|nr:hypothetical protein SteCoe_5639 [Stentor coeruleus]
MVYFMCDLCAETFKKNQVKNHYYQCSTQFMTCVDCNKSYNRQEIDAHTSCKTEAEKYFGKFYQGKKTSEETKGKTSIPQSKAVEPKKVKVNPWKGWKNEIKVVLKNLGSEGETVKKVKKMVMKRFKETHKGDHDVDETFDKKLQFNRFKVLGDRVVYYRYIQNNDI